MRPTESHGTATYAKRAAALVMQVVTFRLLQERYAVPIGQVQEVILCRDVARSFEMPDEVVGIYNLRGAIIPIVDLRRRLGVEGESSGEQQILVCRVKDCVVGFIVDEVLQVMKIPRAEIKPPPSTIIAKAPEHIVGITAQGSTLITIIDIAAGLARETDQPNDTHQEG
jgi:purine-binding chemotaxis protein CheW